jgi:hypothetical protein
MANREIYKVFATQIVVSENNPQGILSDVQGYPKPFDSRSYKATEQNPNGEQEIALLAAQADFKAEALALTMADAPNRVGWVVSIIRTSDGKQIDSKPWGGYPDMTPPEQEQNAE